MPPLAPSSRPVDQQLLGHVLQVAVECEDQVVAGRRPASARAGRPGSCARPAPLAHELARLAGQQVVVLAARGRTCPCRRGRCRRGCSSPGRRSGRIASTRGTSLMPCRSSAAPPWRRVVDLAGHVHELAAARRRRAEQAAGERVRLRGVEAQDRGQAVGGADRIEDEPGIGPDRRLWDGDGKVIAVAVEDGAAGGRAASSRSCAASRRRSGTPRPRPSAGARCVRAGARSRRGRRRGRRPGGGGCARCARCGSGGPAAPGASTGVAVGGRLPTGWAAARRAIGVRHGSCPVVSFTLPHSTRPAPVPASPDPIGSPVAVATWFTTSAVGVRKVGALAGTMPSRLVAVGTM